MYNIDDYYLYPNSSVLRNKFNIRFQSMLDEIEADMVNVNIANLISNPSVLGEQSFNFDYLKRVHNGYNKDTSIFYK